MRPLVKWRIFEMPYLFFLQRSRRIRYFKVDRWKLFSCWNRREAFVSAYGLAAYELSRIRNESNDENNNASITLTVCVAKVAASGGYMLACQATKGHLVTTPFIR